MDVLPFFEVLPQVFASITLDDSSVALLAMLLGMGGGWILTERREQARARKAKIPGNRHDRRTKQGRCEPQE